MLPGTKSNTGALFATSAAPPVGTPFVAGMAVSPEGRLYMRGLGSTWSPLDLFVQNEQGAWYDPSDLSTMFQDSAGSIPVLRLGNLSG